VSIDDHEHTVELREDRMPGWSMTTHTYKRVGDLSIRADVYRDAGESERPVVVFIHGGALIMGHRGWIPEWLVRAARIDDFALVSIDYRLAPETKLPQILADVVDAFGWVREEGARLFATDPVRIAAVGESAGGYLTLASGFLVEPRPTALVSFWGYGDLIGEWYTRPSPHPRHQQPRLTRDEAYRQVSGPPISDGRDRPGSGDAFYQFCRQQGGWPFAVSGWDPEREAEMYRSFMPIANITDGYPPTLLVHGDRDTDVPVEQSALVADELARHGVERRLIVIAGGEHGLEDVPQSEIDDVQQEAVVFLRRHLA
jgi:acetyl esterase/lipase